MKRSESRILTTHTGSLPHPSQLQELLRARDERRALDHAALQASVKEAVAGVVKRQMEVGLDIINDGEQSKPAYSNYVKDRLTGFEGERLMRPWTRLEDADFPEYAQQYGADQRALWGPQPSCTGPIAWKDFSAVGGDIDELRSAAADLGAQDVFMSAASPGVVSYFLPNEYFPSDEAYLYALADAMRDEYNAIA